MTVLLRLLFALAAILALLPAAPAPAQLVRPLTGTGVLEQRIEKLRVVGSLLMIAAHPDDENNRSLAYYAQGRKLRTAYLSLTRGEGGQNLIGPEQGALLGVIRTQELLMARRVDGAEQYFSRAIDFGFSKTAEETFAASGPTSSCSLSPARRATATATIRPPRSWPKRRSMPPPIPNVSPINCRTPRCGRPNASSGIRSSAALTTCIQRPRKR